MAVTPALPGVNVDQVALLRQAGGMRHPDPVYATRPGQYHGADVVFAGPVQAV
ncbi:MAG: pyridoxine 5'-phosphate synthase, partial [Gammaproteobacteria bacterium]|nr:pyridoxine 5'-phosphate synthase [Gammaproteobacteria bacterium]